MLKLPKPTSSDKRKAPSITSHPIFTTTTELGKNLLSSALSRPDNPYIMSGSTRLARISLDTVILNLHLKETVPIGDSLFSLLAPKKLELQSTSHDLETTFDYEKGNKFFEWNIHRVGSKLFPYVLSNGDIRLLLSTRSLEHGDKPNAQIHIGSLSSQESALTVIRRVKSWLSLFGILVKDDSVSRVDMCHDFTHSIRDKRVSLCDNDKIVSKAVKHAVYYSHRKLTGVQYGKGDIVLRMYDKMLEIKQPDNEHKLCFFTEKWGKIAEQRQNSKEIKDVTRIEFQLRRNALKEFLKIGNFSDFLNNFHKIWNYLTKVWFRHCKKIVDRKNRNQDKVEVSYFWKAVQEISKLEEMACRTKAIIRKKSMKCLRAQLRGLATTIAAGFGHEPNDHQGIIDTARNIINEDFERCFAMPEWEKKFETRRKNTLLVYDDDFDERHVYDETAVFSMFKPQALPINF